MARVIGRRDVDDALPNVRYSATRIRNAEPVTPTEAAFELLEACLHLREGVLLRVLHFLPRHTEA
jgi:hypothetical protein